MRPFLHGGNQSPDVLRRDFGRHASAAGNDETRVVAQRVEHVFDGALDVSGSSGGQDVAWRDISDKGNPVAGPFLHFLKGVLDTEVEQIDADFG